MASNIKWYKRALRALDSGRLDVWEKIRKKLPDDRRSYLESKYNLIEDLGTSVKSLMTEPVSDPATKGHITKEVETEVAEPTIAPTTAKKTTTKKKTTKKKTSKKKTTIKTKKMDKETQNG